MISLSNLVKYSLVRETGDKKLVINSNRRLDKKLSEYQKQQEQLQRQQEEVAADGQEFLITEQEQSDGEEGFSEGLAAPVISEEEAAVLLEEARQQAQETANAEAAQILERARAEAAQIMDQAAADAEALRESKQSEGYSEGLEKGRLELQEEKEAAEREYQKRRGDLEEEFKRKQKELEPELVDAIIQVFDRVFRIQFEDKRPILLSLVENTLSNIETGKSFHIHVSEANRAFIEAHMEDMKSKIGNDVSIEVSADPTFDDAACTIETDFGIFDCGIDVELANLVRDIRSLSYD